MRQLGAAVNNFSFLILLIDELTLAVLEGFGEVP
jgi:hypothetical protein